MWRWCAAGNAIIWEAASGSACRPADTAQERAGRTVDACGRAMGNSAGEMSLERAMRCEGGRQVHAEVPFIPHPWPSVRWTRIEQLGTRSGAAATLL